MTRKKGLSFSSERWSTLLGGVINQMRLLYHHITVVANTHVPYLRKPWFGLDCAFIILFHQWKKRQRTQTNQPFEGYPTPKPWSKGHRLGLCHHISFHINCTFHRTYPLVIRHGLLENPPFKVR